MGLTKKDIKLVTDPLWDNNPVTVQVLGICSALAITAQSGYRNESFLYLRIGHGERSHFST